MIEKIILKVGEKSIELTEDEARQVWTDLNPRFNPGTFTAPIIPYYPYTYPYITCEYAGMSGWKDLNLRQPGSRPGTLPN